MLFVLRKTAKAFAADCSCSCHLDFGQPRCRLVSGPKSTYAKLRALQISEFAGRVKSVKSNFRPDYSHGEFRMARVYSSALCMSTFDKSTSQYIHL